jgi:hypothetical protein
MKSIIFYTSMIMTLLVLNLAFGGIQPPITGGNGGATEVSANAEDGTTYDYDSGSGWNFNYSDTPGYYHWKYTCTPHVSGFISGWVEGESALSQASTTVKAYVSKASPISDESSAGGALEDANDNWKDAPGSITGEGWAFFAAYNGVWAYSEGFALAHIEEGSTARAYAMTYSAAVGQLW